MKKQLKALAMLLMLVFAVSLITACEEAPETETETVEQAVSAEMVTTKVLFAVDRSASMLGYGFLPYVSDALAEVVLEMEDFAEFGLIVFPGSACAPGGGPAQACSTPAEPYVLIDPDYSSAEDIVDVFDTWEEGVGVCGATPTAAALDVSKAYLNEIDDGSPQMVVLLTDGAPNCNFDLVGSECECTDASGCNTKQHLCLDDLATGQAAAALGADNIPVYVLSIGEEVTPFDHVMDAIAFEGGTTEALTAKEVTDVAPRMSEVQPEMYSCQVAMDWGKISELTKESKVSDMVDKISLLGKESATAKESKISYNPGCAADGGFDLTTDNKISLCASICDQLKESKISKISATAKISKESLISKESKISAPVPGA